jgi:polysaccharide biosynthesis transport protein
MSKIYEALRRHESVPVKALNGHAREHSQGSIIRALEPIYPIIGRLSGESKRGLIVHFVAASLGEGTSTLSGQFALLASRAGSPKVLLIDADKDQLTTAGTYGCDTEHGVLEEFEADRPIEERILNFADNPALSVAPLVGRRSRPGSLRVLPALYDQLRSKYELTVVDCPPVLSDRYLELSPDSADGIVLVVQAEHTRPAIIRNAQARIEDAGGKLIGAVLNRRHTYIPRFLYRLL